jgi:ribonuclease VapC
VILDSSAIVAIIRDEPERAGFAAKIGEATAVGVGAPTVLETGIVLTTRLRADASELVAEFLVTTDATVIEFGDRHWREALSAFARFGKGRHPAQLNFGDCLAYATSRLANEPLLARGGDFALTDIELA